MLRLWVLSLPSFSQQRTSRSPHLSRGHIFLLLVHLPLRKAHLWAVVWAQPVTCSHLGPGSRWVRKDSDTWGPWALEMGHRKEGPPAAVTKQCGWGHDSFAQQWRNMPATVYNMPATVYNMPATVFNISCLKIKHCPPGFALQDHSSSRPFLGSLPKAWWAPDLFPKKKIPFLLTPPRASSACLLPRTCPLLHKDRRRGRSVTRAWASRWQGGSGASGPGPEQLSWELGCPWTQVGGPGHQRPAPLSATWEAPLAFLWPLQLLVGWHCDLIREGLGPKEPPDSFLFLVVNFVIHWNETAMGLHVFPIPNPLPPPSPPAPSRSSQCTRSERLSHASSLGWWSVSP